MEMSHFEMTNCASASLADIRRREEQPSRARNYRNNTLEEHRKKRLKRNQTRKHGLKALSNKSRQNLRLEKMCAKRLEQERGTFQQELTDLQRRNNEERRKGIHCWKMWRHERARCIPRVDRSRFHKEMLLFSSGQDKSLGYTFNQTTQHTGGIFHRSQ